MTFKNMFYGFLHLLVAFTSIVVVTSILQFNLPAAFLFAGISTIVFHIVTKNKLPVTMGVSGLYIGSILYVVQTYGRAYVGGGVIVAGVIYIIFGLIMSKWQDKLMKYFPDWLLSTAVMLIGLSLLPIGKSLMAGSLLVGGVAFAVTALCDLSKVKILNMFAMLWGIVAGTITQIIAFGLNTAPLHTPLAMTFVKPAFALAPSLTIGLLAFAVLFEMLGDVKNTGDIMGQDIFKEVGLAKISIANGITALISGGANQNAYTTYSENAGFLLLTKYFNPWAQVFTGLFFIILAFVTPVSQAIMCLPMAAFGGVVTYLFAIITINAIKQLLNSGIDLANDKKVFVILSVMLGVSMLSFVVGGISISSVAVATLIGMVLNIIIK